MRGFPRRKILRFYGDLSDKRTRHIWRGLSRSLLCLSLTTLTPMTFEFSSKGAW